VEPSSFVNVSFTNGALQAPQVAFTLMPHESQIYVAIFNFLSVGSSIFSFF